MSLSFLIGPRRLAIVAGVLTAAIAGLAAVAREPAPKAEKAAVADPSAEEAAALSSN